MPLLSLSVHNVASEFEVNSSARIGTSFASLPNPINGSFSWRIRAKSIVVIADWQSSVSALEPPLIAARSVPPFLMAALAEGVVDVVEDPLLVQLAAPRIGIDAPASMAARNSSRR